MQEKPDDAVLPFQLGLTGGIGAGKSAAARIFELLGAPVYEADLHAKRLMATHIPLRRALIRLLGPQSYATDGALNRDFIRAQLLQGPLRKAQIEACVHPFVQTDYSAWRSRQTASYVIKVAALLCESGQYASLNALVLVCAPWSLRLRRLRARDPHLSRSQIEALRDSQWPEAQKKTLAHRLIHNDEKHSLIAQALDLHQWIQQQIKPSKAP